MLLEYTGILASFYVVGDTPGVGRFANNDEASLSGS